MRRYTILVVYVMNRSPMRATLRDALYSFRECSGHRCFYLNLSVRSVPWYFRHVRFDLIVFGTLFLANRIEAHWFQPLLRKVQPLRAIDAVKVALPQDEHTHSGVLMDFFEDFGISAVFSVGAESTWREIYPRVDFEKVRFFRVLTGYLGVTDDDPETPRPIDIGYRTWTAGPWLGRHGLLRQHIADAFREAAPSRGFTTDISTRAEDTIWGDEWLAFLRRCRWAIGVEGGASIVDREGTLKARVQAYQRDHPHATFEEIERACFPGRDGGIHYTALSPRHLECCATRTGQVLVEGEYNGVLVPGEHYLELKKDFSNLDRVLDAMADEELRREMTERAHRDVVRSGKYTYRTFVDTVLRGSLDDREPRATSLFTRIAYAWNRLSDRLAWMQIAFGLHSLVPRLKGIIRSVLFSRPGPMPEITVAGEGEPTPVDVFWNRHLVDSSEFRSAWQSRRHLRWRDRSYPLFAKLMNLYGARDGQVILDYGCGPGSDIVGFCIFTKAAKVIGIDISSGALELARRRIALHRIDPARVELIRSADASPRIPLADASVDAVHCLGVLQHTSHPAELLAEFHRVLRPGGEARVMVYNRASVWVHLYAAYERLIVHDAFPGSTVDEIFHRTVDVEPDGTGLCPIARCYEPHDFLALSRAAGFEADYLGGYLSEVELRSIARYLREAMRDERLAPEHRDFLASLRWHDRIPIRDGKPAGLSGVYRLRKN